MREHRKKKHRTYSVPTLFVPFKRMQLNPNGKIDKPGLPFHDAAQLSSILSSLEAQAPAAETSKQALSPTTVTMQKIWHSLHPPASPADIPPDESFFDLGDHSILATRLVFGIRKVFVVDVPLGTMFDVDADHGGGTTVRGMVKRVEAARRGELGELELAIESEDSAKKAKGLEKDKADNAVKYGEDYDALVKNLANSYPLPAPGANGKPLRVFLTGATGFLGAFVLYDSLEYR